MNSIVQKAIYKSPIGLIEIRGTSQGITSIDFNEEGETSKKIPDCLVDCYNQLNEYFKGQRREFFLTLIINATNFQTQVYEKLREIPYGRTASYKDIAIAINNEKAVRAVGGANNKNKHAIVVPCHRIIGHNGGLVGYGSGLWRKEWLLEHEQKHKVIPLV